MGQSVHSRGGEKWADSGECEGRASRTNWM